jgi:hypothetical protein
MSKQRYTNITARQNWTRRAAMSSRNAGANKAHILAGIAIGGVTPVENADPRECPTYRVLALICVSVGQLVLAVLGPKDRHAVVLIVHGHCWEQTVLPGSGCNARVCLQHNNTTNVGGGGERNATWYASHRACTGCHKGPTTAPPPLSPGTLSKDQALACALRKR